MNSPQQYYIILGRRLYILACWCWDCSSAAPRLHNILCIVISDMTCALSPPSACFMTLVLLNSLHSACLQIMASIKKRRWLILQWKFTPTFKELLNLKNFTQKQIDWVLCNNFMDFLLLYFNSEQKIVFKIIWFEKKTPLLIFYVNLDRRMCLLSSPKLLELLYSTCTVNLFKILAMLFEHYTC